MTPETWMLAQRGNDAQGIFVWVDRHQDGRTTSWKMRNLTGKWKIYEIFFSRENAGLNRVPERLKEYYYERGIKLTDNRIDRMLLSFATTGHGLTS